MGKKLTYQEVQNRFNEAGCKLLEKEYLNNYTKMEYICICGNKSKIVLQSFSQGHRCQKCGSQKAASKTKNTFQYVQKYFADCNCKLLETEYTGNKTKMKYICSCGNSSRISFNNLTAGQRCIKCGGREKYTFEEVSQYFNNEGCELLEDAYANNRTLMRYICNCGDLSEIKFISFQRGTRCKKCNKKNNNNYNSNLTDKDREDRRKNPEYKQWVKDVYKKDNYTCKKCFKVGDKLNAHHIEGFAENEKLRIDINNGVTFCQKCHNKFHAQYGKKNIGRKQYNNFIKFTGVVKYD